MTANPNTACKPLGDEQEDRVMYTPCQPDGVWTMQHEETFHPVNATPERLERNRRAARTSQTPTGRAFEGRPLEKAPISNLNLNTDTWLETFIRISALSVVHGAVLTYRWNYEKRLNGSNFVIHQTFQKSVRKYNLNGQLVPA